MKFPHYYSVAALLLTLQLACTVMAGTNLSPFFTALQIGNMQKIRELATKQSLDSVMDNGATALHVAVANNHTSLVKFLLKEGADAQTATTTHNITPLHLAALLNSPTLIKLLLMHGAPINAQDAKGNTPLHLAAYLENKNAINLLVSNDAQTTYKNNDGVSYNHIETALRKSSRNSRLKTILKTVGVGYLVTTMTELIHPENTTTLKTKRTQHIPQFILHMLKHYQHTDMHALLHSLRNKNLFLR